MTERAFAVLPSSSDWSRGLAHRLVGRIACLDIVHRPRTVAEPGSPTLVKSGTRRFRGNVVARGAA
jgi:hypothetical protein